MTFLHITPTGVRVQEETTTPSSIARTRISGGAPRLSCLSGTIVRLHYETGFGIGAVGAFLRAHRLNDAGGKAETS